MIPPCSTLSNIRYISMVKWSNPGKGEVPSLTPRCSSYWKGSLQVTLDNGRQLTYLLTYIAIQHIPPPWYLLWFWPTMLHELIYAYKYLYFISKPEFKPVKLRLKIDLVSYPARAEGLGKYDKDFYTIPTVFDCIFFFFDFFIPFHYLPDDCCL